MARGAAIVAMLVLGGMTARAQTAPAADATPAAAAAAPADATAGTTAKPGGPPPAAVPFWQAPAMPTAVIQGGVIPPGWQPQAVPYQGIGPDGRPMTMYVAPTYVFTYQSGPPVLAAPPVNRRQPMAPAASGWNFQASGAPPVAGGLPGPTVTRYQPPPYQFPANSRALTGTPIAPPGVMTAQPTPQAWANAPQQPLAQPPAQWVPSDVPPPPGVAPAAAPPAAPASPQLPPVEPIPYPPR